MEFLCEELPEHGLVLVPFSSPEYDPLLADIQRRLDQPVDGAPPIPEKFRPRILEENRPASAILLNRSPKDIAAMQAVWFFETVTGRSYRHSRGMLSVQSLLLPFGSDDSLLKLYGYWHTILPGSKRYLSESGMVGDNTDVRPPAANERWRGGVSVNTGGWRGGEASSDPVKQITLVLDGVFFLDGEFIGPNREKLFERTVADAEAHLVIAQIARDAHNRGLSTAQIFEEIEKATGPAPEHPIMNVAFRNLDATPEEFRRAALGQIAFHLETCRRFPRVAENDERTVYMLMRWTETVVPRFRKR